MGSKKKVLGIFLAVTGLGRTGLVWEQALWGHSFLVDLLPGRSRYVMAWSWGLWSWLPAGEGGLLLQQLPDCGRGSSSHHSSVPRGLSELSLQSVQPSPWFKNSLYVFRNSFLFRSVRVDSVLCNQAEPWMTRQGQVLANASWVVASSTASSAASSCVNTEIAGMWSSPVPWGHCYIPTAALYCPVCWRKRPLPAHRHFMAKRNYLKLFFLFIFLPLSSRLSSPLFSSFFFSTRAMQTAESTCRWYSVHTDTHLSNLSCRNKANYNSAWRQIVLCLQTLATALIVN